jgi:hypothetical protein
MLGNYPKENIIYSEHGESSKSRILYSFFLVKKVNLSYEGLDQVSYLIDLCFDFADVVTIEKTGEYFRLIYDVKGRFTIHRITAEEAKVNQDSCTLCVKLGGVQKSYFKRNF